MSQPAVLRRLILPDRAVSVLLDARHRIPQRRPCCGPRRRLGRLAQPTQTLPRLLHNIHPFLHLHSSAFLPSPSTSTLFSAFESWLVSSSFSAGVIPAALSSIMGRATFTNGLVARRNNSRDRLLGLASVGIRPENWGNGGGQADTGLLAHTSLSSSECPLCKKAAPSPACPSARIFSAFTISTMLGSLIYTTLTALSRGALQDPRRTGVPSGGGGSPLMAFAKLSSLEPPALAARVKYQLPR
ncbi:hypothetical protein D9611_012007 [Ephemerocybe angulata]|uniref:Uncharacterized protein n=1 Tax=Ephemerocybe angulata TaxID=980116 RepID=A0A8H5C410_9AGAR|nr:hypothetical protein D9611_012007 [Tulosesus angulatus]